MRLWILQIRKQYYTVFTVSAILLFMKTRNTKSLYSKVMSDEQQLFLGLSSVTFITR